MLTGIRGVASVSGTSDVVITLRRIRAGALHTGIRRGIAGRGIAGTIIIIGTVHAKPACRVANQATFAIRIDRTYRHTSSAFTNHTRTTIIVITAACHTLTWTTAFLTSLCIHANRCLARTLPAAKTFRYIAGIAMHLRITLATVV